MSQALITCKEENEMDIQMYHNQSRFKLRTSALIIENNKLLMAKNTNEDDPTYYTVGGKIEMGESSREAVVREAFEETGINYTIDRLVYIQELFYEATFLPGASHFHEIIFHYLMKPTAITDFNNDSYTQSGFKENLYWIPLDEVKNIYTYPRFLGNQLMDLPDYTEHIISYENYK